MKKCKNLVAIHMDTLSHFALWQFRVELDPVWRLMNKSMYFRRCHVAGSATPFALSSLSFGSVAPFDAVDSEKWIDDHATTNTRGLFQILRDDLGYDTTCIMAHNLPNPLPIQNYVPGVDRMLAESFLTERNPALDVMAASVASGRPFGLFLMNCCDMTLRHYQKFDFGDTTGTIEQIRWMVRLSAKVVENAVAGLNELGVLDDTLVVLYGDHGFPLYHHLPESRFDEGCLLVPECVWVPLMLFNSSMGIGITDNLASLEDLRNTILGQLSEEEAANSEVPSFPSVDLARTSREFVFSQNKNALQNDRARKNETLKAYSVTDGSYRLIVKAAHPGADEGGMSLYMDQSDYGNRFNILQLLELKDDGQVVGVNPSMLSKRKSIFFFDFNIRSLLKISEHYNRLWTALKRYVHDKEEFALAKKDAPPHTFPQRSFTFVEHPVPQSGLGVYHIVKRNRPILIFGAAERGRDAAGLFLHFKGRVVGFMDNTPELQGKTIDELPVFAPAEASEKYPNALAIISVVGVDSYHAMTSQCRGLAMESYCLYKDIFAMPMYQGPGKWIMME